MKILKEDGETLTVEIKRSTIVRFFNYQLWRVNQRGDGYPALTDDEKKVAEALDLVPSYYRTSNDEGG